MGDSQSGPVQHRDECWRDCRGRHCPGIFRHVSPWRENRRTACYMERPGNETTATMFPALDSHRASTRASWETRCQREGHIRLPQGPLLGFSEVILGFFPIYSHCRKVSVTRQSQTQHGYPNFKDRNLRRIQALAPLIDLRTCFCRRRRSIALGSSHSHRCLSHY